MWRASEILPGLRTYQPDVFHDHRGDYAMVYNRREFDLGVDFVEDCISTSKRLTLRGMHLDPVCQKLITVLHGAIYYVVLDAESGRFDAMELNDENRKVVFKPSRYAAGFLALTDEVVFHYKQSHYYDPMRQSTYPWNGYGIPWPLEGTPILSRRDDEAARSWASGVQVGR